MQTRHARTVVAYAFVSVVAAGLAISTSSRPAQAATTVDAFEQCLLDKANEARAAVGVGALQMATDVVADVRGRSEWMRFNEFEHTPRSVLIAILPPSLTRAGENIAWHSTTDVDDCTMMHNLWMNSRGHRENILSPLYRFVAMGMYTDSTGWWGTQLFFDATNYHPPCIPKCDDELMLYNPDGSFAYYQLDERGNFGDLIRRGSNFTRGWSAITPVDLDGDGRDEIFFYRDDGLYRFYRVNRDGSIGSPIKAGNNFTKNWTSVEAVDLDGDGQDEMFFYRRDGLFRYYNVRSDGSIGRPLVAGDNYTRNWTSITSVDLDRDGQDEMFFYRRDGLFRYYNVRADGSLGSPLNSGAGYPTGWEIIRAVDVDGR